MRSVEAYMSIGRRRAVRFAWGILCLCTGACIFGLSALPDSVLGFALVFGSGLLAYESIVVILGINKNERTHVGSARVPRQQTEEEPALSPGDSTTMKPPTGAAHSCNVPTGTPASRSSSAKRPAA